MTSERVETGLRDRERERRVALIQGFVAGMLFGTTAIFIRLLGGLDVFSIAFWRLAIASSILFAIIISLRKRFGSGLLKENLGQILVLGILLGLHFILFVSAVMDTAILNATMLVNTTPVWSMLVSAFIFNIKPSRLALLGLATSFLGVGIIAYADAVPFQGLTFRLKGDLEAMIAAVAEAFYLNYGRETRRKVPLLSLMLSIYIFSALTILVAGILTGSTLTMPYYRLELILPLIGLGVLPTGVAHTLYFSSLSSLKSFETATMALLEPLGATLLGVLIFSEIPSSLFIVGAVFVLVGIITITIKE